MESWFYFPDCFFQKPTRDGWIPGENCAKIDVGLLFRSLIVTINHTPVSWYKQKGDKEAEYTKHSKSRVHPCFRHAQRQGVYWKWPPQDFLSHTGDCTQGIVVDCSHWEAATAGVDLNLTCSGRHPIVSQRSTVTVPHTPLGCPTPLPQSLASNSFFVQFPPEKKKKSENIKNEREGEEKYENQWAQRTSEGYFVDVLGCCPNGTTIPAYTTMPFKVWNPLFVVLCLILCLTRWLLIQWGDRLPSE